MGGLLRDGHGGRLGELLEGGYGEGAGGAAAAEREARRIGGGGRRGEEREGEAGRSSGGGGGSHGHGDASTVGRLLCFASAASGGGVSVNRIGCELRFGP